MAGVAEQRRDPSHPVDDVKIALPAAPVIRAPDAKQGICSGLHGQIGDVDWNTVGRDWNARDDRAGRRIETKQVAGSSWSWRRRKPTRRLCGCEQGARRVKRKS